MQRLAASLSPIGLIILGGVLVLHEVVGLGGGGPMDIQSAGIGLLLLMAGGLLKARGGIGHAASPTRIAPLSDQDLRAMLQDSATENMALLTRDAAPQSWYAAPMVVEIIVPLSDPAAATSWIGGMPSLPDDVCWPDLAGRPAVFLAQINCADLPRGLWAGMAPQQGWLVFFCGAGYMKDVAVLHTGSPGRPRPSPVPVPHWGMHLDPSLALAKLGGQADHPALRWPVRLRPLLNYDERKTCFKGDLPDNPRNAFLLQAQMGNAIYHPFDWISARALMDAACDTLDAELKMRTQGTTKPDAAQEALMDDLRRRLSLANEMSATLEGASRTIPFDSSVRDNLYRMLVDVGYAASVGDAGDKTVAWRTKRVMKRQAALIDAHARAVYVTAPDALPQALRAALEPVWAFDAQAERAHMGGATPEHFVYDRAEDPVLLLELPTSDLTGRMFGDMNSFGVFISPEALKSGDLSQAWGRVSN